jgi:hypothetical protein
MLPGLSCADLRCMSYCCGLAVHLAYCVPASPILAMLLHVVHPPHHHLLCCWCVVPCLPTTPCQATSALLLPGPLELSTEGLQEPPPLVDDVDDYDPEVRGSG